MRPCFPLGLPSIRSAISAAIALLTLAESSCGPHAPPSRPDELDWRFVDAPKTGTEIVVVDGSTGKPVPDAVVTWFEPGALHDAEVGLAPEPALTALRRKRGKSVRTDSNGKTKIGYGSFVIASAGNRFGTSKPGRVHQFAPEQCDPIRIELKAGESIVIACRDDRGKPVEGVPVAIVGLSIGPSSVTWRSRTGADGRVALGPIDVLADLGTSRADFIDVALDGCASGKERREFPIGEIPQGPIEFVLRSTGSLAIEVVDEDGRPFKEPHWIFVRPTSPRDAAEDSNEEGATGTGEVDRTEYVDGIDCWQTLTESPRTVVEAVELGSRFLIRLSGDAVPDRSVSIDGPTIPGQCVEARVVVPRPRSLLGCVRDGSAKPYADARLSIQLGWETQGEGGHATLPTTCDGRGRFAVELPLGFLDDVDRAERVEIEIGVLDSRDTLVASRRIPLPPVRRDGVYDLGDVTLAPTRLVARGHVVDDEGKAVSGLRLSLIKEWTASEGEEVSATADGSGASDAAPRAGEKPDAYIEFTERCESQADGSFVLNAPPATGSYLLRVAGRGDGSSPGSYLQSDNSVETVMPGSEDVTIRVHRTGFVVLFISDPPAELHRVRVNVTSRLSTQKTDRNVDDCAIGDVACGENTIEIEDAEGSRLQNPPIQVVVQPWTVTTVRIAAVHDK